MQLLTIALLFLTTTSLAQTEVTVVSENTSLKELAKEIGLLESHSIWVYPDEQSKKIVVFHDHPSCSGDPKKRHHFCVPFRNRSLSSVNHFLSYLKTDLFKEINKRGSSKDTSVLEIGMGQGRILAELALTYPQVQFHGINKEAGELGFADKTTLVELSNFFKLKPAPMLDDFKNVELHFKDLDTGKLMFPDNSVDIIYSFATIRYLRNKTDLINDIWRVLKKDGVAFLQLQLMNIEDTKGAAISFKDYVKANFNDRMHFDPVRRILMVRKNQPSFKLNLEQLDNRSKQEQVIPGWQSYFIFRPAKN